MQLESLRDKARGSLLGAAIGDAMGAPCEGMSAQAIREQYGVITDFLTDEISGTDDTDFTLFNAHILQTYGVKVTSEQIEYEWRDKLLSGKYYYRPGGFSDVISTRNLEAGLQPPQSGAFNHQMWSDGVAMAISAAGIACPGDPAQAAQVAHKLGSISNARDGIYTAQAVAAAISMAMVDATPIDMIEAALANVPQDSWTYRAMLRAQQVAKDAADLEEALILADERLVVHYWPWADLTTEAVPVAFAVFLAAQGEFVKAVPAGVRIGRDADTIGAIVGCLAGAYGGTEAIPQEWRERVQASTGRCIGYVANRQITDIADELVKKATNA
ncbi:MAG: crystallin J1 [Anaerolineaceae bacterium]|nr:crystallin J1 [Anaerolineaceae bacterium]